MTAFVVFYRRLTNEQIDAVNKLGWFGTEAGIAYLDSEPRGENEPKYEGAIVQDTFEKAAFARDCSDKESVFRVMQNDFAAWRDNPDLVCYTRFARSMSVGDVVYEPATDEWSYVASFGFEPVTNELFIEYLRTKLTGPDL